MTGSTKISLCVVVIAVLSTTCFQYGSPKEMPETGIELSIESDKLIAAALEKRKIWIDNVVKEETKTTRIKLDDAFRKEWAYAKERVENFNTQMARTLQPLILGNRDMSWYMTRMSTKLRTHLMMARQEIGGTMVGGATTQLEDANTLVTEREVRLQRLFKDLDGIFQEKDLNHCPKGWIRIPNKCIYVRLDKAYRSNWQGAQSHCASYRPGGQLAMMENDLENLYVREILRGNTAYERDMTWCYWFGLSDLKDKRNWKLGTPPYGLRTPSFTRWEAGSQPSFWDGKVHPRCACASWAEYKFWVPKECNQYKRFICQVEQTSASKAL